MSVKTNLRATQPGPDFSAFLAVVDMSDPLDPQAQKYDVTLSIDNADVQYVNCTPPADQGAGPPPANPVLLKWFNRDPQVFHVELSFQGNGAAIVTGSASAVGDPADCDADAWQVYYP